MTQSVVTCACVPVQPISAASRSGTSVFVYIRHHVTAWMVHIGFCLFRFKRLSSHVVISSLLNLIVVIELCTLFHSFKFVSHLYFSLKYTLRNQQQHVSDNCLSQSFPIFPILRFFWSPCFDISSRHHVTDLVHGLHMLSTPKSVPIFVHLSACLQHIKPAHWHFFFTFLYISSN